MLDIMVGTVREVPSNTPEEVEVIARGLASVVQRGPELSVSAQVLCSESHTNLERTF